RRRGVRGGAVRPCRGEAPVGRREAARERVRALLPPPVVRHPRPRRAGAEAARRARGPRAAGVRHQLRRLGLPRLRGPGARPRAARRQRRQAPAPEGLEHVTSRPEPAPGRVLVTGGASGIGLACAGLLAARGWDVQVADLRPGPGRHELDVADRSSWERVLEAAWPLDALVNCAGHRSRGGITELDAAEFERMLSVHVTGTFLGVQGCARRWLDAGTRGAVVTVSSVTATHAVTGQPHYVA